MRRPPIPNRALLGSVPFASVAGLFVLAALKRACGITSPPRITPGPTRFRASLRQSPPARCSTAITACNATWPTAAGDGHKKPSLKTDRIRTATDGDLEWFLRQGDLAHGMPSWSSLPEAQRWQIVTYLRSLQ